ncbi:MAG TPA: pyrroline-5-carboxylate reductase [Stellaceae bacterium]|jgi:pyrroline-5-carboxylate reductase|nr:pyrroline-5-carboxylate reductase [Stellaceae bacterium]
MSAGGKPPAMILLLIGCGKMGGALLKGWLERGAARHVVVVEPGAGADAFAGERLVERHKRPEEIPLEFAPDVVVFAVKPQVMDGAVSPYKRFVGRSLFLSIAAGKTLRYFGRLLDDEAAVVRAMPNTPAAVGRGITVATANPRVTPTQRRLADTLLSAVGEVGWVDDETLIDAVTAVSGSGPAYVFLLIECLAKAGVAAGLPAELATRLARATVAGSGELARLSHEPASKLREAVTSPGGTTRAALDVLMATDGLEPLMIKAVAAAARRSRELAD